MIYFNFCRYNCHVIEYQEFLKMLFIWVSFLKAFHLEVLSFGDLV